MLKYRADIDGLRAFAVLAVIIFHINPNWLPNGYLGVDMFFVLSGFLISTILYKDIIGGTFSFKTFYTRRIRRILPVFFVVLFATLGFAYYFFLPRDAISVGKSAIGASLFIANILFARHSEYFDVSSEEKPLLHIWSLSVEEQFYFVFPIILIGLIALFARLRQTSSSPEKQRRFLLYSICGMLCLSLVSSFVPIKYNDIVLSKYYLPQIRFAELLIGSLGAVYLSSTEVDKQYKSSALWGTIALLILIICLIIPELFTSDYFPGPLALIPCGATMLLIYHNRRSYWLSRLLSYRPIVWIGKISYSLYLWHWVLLAFIRYFWGVGILPNYLVWGGVLLTFLFSALTYYFIEQPIRRSSLSLGQSLTYFYCIPASLVIAIFVYKTEFEPLDASYEGFSEGATCCFNSLEGDCIMGDETKTPKVLIAGDSHTAQLANFWDYVGKHEGWSAFVTASISCPFFIEYDNYVPWQGEGVCQARNEFLRQVYRDYPVIVLANYWSAVDYACSPDFIPQLRITLDRLLSEGKKVYCVNSSYQVNTPPVREYYARQKGLNLYLERWDRDPRGHNYTLTKGYADRICQLIKQEYPEVNWIDLEPYIPHNLMYDNKPMMGDSHHLNSYGAKVIAKLFCEREHLIDSKDLH